jgi:hypothetical protein
MARLGPLIHPDQLGCYDRRVTHRLGVRCAIALVPGLAALLACGGAHRLLSEARPGALRQSGLRAPDDPTVRGARLLPEALDQSPGWGVEPGGGVRAIVAGVRVVSMADGAMLVAADRLPATPSGVVALPDRLGHGFLFAIGTRVWGAEAWLAPAHAVFASAVPVAQVLIGLDRVYVRSQQGALVAFDPRTGIPVDLGPAPASPSVGRLAALDAWRAVAVADLRGALLTLDAGSTWRPLALPFDPSEVVVLDDAIAVGGLDEGRQMQWWEVRSDGQAGKLSTAPSSTSPPDRAPAPIDVAARVFGPRPLVAAIEDGWPLVDGTALVARDGALGRVRLADGALVESIGNAFPLKPSRCHAISLARAVGPSPGQGGTPNDGALGFACGEPRGRTILYRWDAPSAHLAELRAFQNPREVLGFGNGALAVRGPCAASATGDAVGGNQTWCVMPPSGSWREMQGATDERLVVLSDGRVARVRSPQAGGLSTARLTVADGARSEELPILLPPLPNEVARAVRLGIWMDGFEERRSGVVGGWIDAAESLVGIEVDMDGRARVGEYIRDAGGPVASGRWAFGATASRRGFETTDGGMTWTKEIALPDPIASGHQVHERVCGPVGCIAAGWLRVGWGATAQAPTAELPPQPPPRTHPPPNLELDCEPLAGPPLEPLVRRATPRPAPGSLVVHTPMGTYAGSTWGAVTEFPPFAGRAGPSIPADDLGLDIEVSNGAEHALRAAPLAHVYAWGPRNGEWDQLGRWQVLWQWPWGGWPDLRSSTAFAAPWTSLDAARRAMGKGQGVPTAWAIAEGDDPDHALLLARHALSSAAVDVLLLETDRPPIEVHRANGAPFPDVEGAVRMGGHWFVATTQSPAELLATVVWSLEGATAREIARVPRAGFEARRPLRLARRTDGRGLGLVVDGQFDAVRGTTMRWVASVDLDSSSLATPEPLAPIDLSDRNVTLCTGDDAGWELDLPYPGTVRLHTGTRWESALQAPVVRMHLSHERACVDRVLGSVDAYGSTAPEELARRMRPFGAGVPIDKPGAAAVRTIEVNVFSARKRHGLRCVAR